MLCGVALHHELAALRAEVGPQVFDDPVSFRAAFDDFVPEGSASTGEVSLLVGAIATGALQRVKEQLALGADPEMTIAVQGDLLARDRGTSESTGARWALSALAHAVGALPAELVPTRPTPGADSVATVGRPPAQSPGIVDPGPTQQSGDATRVVSQEPPAPAATSGGRGRRRMNALLVAAVVVLAVVAVAAVALLLLRDDDAPAEIGEDSAGGTGGSSDEEVLSSVDLTDAEEPIRVELVRNGSDVELVLFLERDGELTEVDREPAACPYLESSYEPEIESTGGLDLFWGWSNLDQEGFGQYGTVIPEIESIDVFGVEEGYVCPTE